MTKDFYIAWSRNGWGGLSFIGAYSTIALAKEKCPESDSEQEYIITRCQLDTEKDEVVYHRDYFWETGITTVHTDIENGIEGS